MRYACFGKAKDLEWIRHVGFEGVEMDLCQLRHMTDSEYTDLKRRLNALNLQVCAFSWILENNIHICDPAFGRENWLIQFEEDARRVAGLGCDKVVFAAGPIRRVGNDTDTPRKVEIINRFILDSAIAFGKHGVKLVLETVCCDYTDYLTALKDSAKLCEEGDNLYLLCDVRHLVRAGDEPDDIVRFAKHIIHGHIDNPIPIPRVAPLPSDGYCYVPYLRRIIQTNAQWLSFECHDEPDWQNNGPISLDYIKTLVDKLSGKQQ